jgi:tetratricopeptide (TPR) repeat protein
VTDDLYVPDGQARLASAFEAYLMADEEHRRGPADLLLRLPGARGYVLGKLPGLSDGQKSGRAAVWRLASFDAISRLPADGNDWLMTAVSWLEDGNATWQESAGVCAEVGFRAYLADKPDPVTLDMISSRGPLTASGRAMLHLHLIALRLAYRWEAMEECLAALGTAVETLDPYSRVYHVFALLAENHPAGLEEMAKLLAVAGDDYRVNLSLVEGLRLSRGIPDQAARMLDLLDSPALSTSQSPDPLYRKAFALRKLGRYDEALRVADECLQKIPPLQVQDRVRILQERDLILAEQAIKQQAAAARTATHDRIQAATQELEQLVASQLAELRRATADGLFRVVEILGVFTAIIAIIGGGAASVVAKSLAWWQRGVLLLIAGTVAIAFFWLLRTIVNPRITQPGPDREPRS